MKKIVPLALILFLHGCGTPPVKKPSVVVPQATTTAQWKNHQEKMMALNQWQAEGRLAVTQGKKGANASFVWQQTGDHFDVKLFGPFGSGAVYISGNPQWVTLKETNGKIHSAKSPEQLLQSVAGWQVPLTGLHYWMRGIPSPKGQTTQHQIGDHGFLQSLQQDGWQIDYDGYLVDNATVLPSKLNLQNKKLKVKMVIKNWKV
jgi:outer membrane lipoprotein LolB